MSDILTRMSGKIGHISLNRPAALHALTLDMCRAMTAVLQAWAEDERIEAIIIDHASAPDDDPKKSRGFCAGGDINMLRNSALHDAGVSGCAFFHDEYQLNHLLFTYPKPILAFMDGITMGGGVGISQPARFRIATENTRFAMPETGIGLFPDVGGGWYLSRLPGRVGVFLGLTGARLDGAECMAVGLATHYLPADRIVAAKRRISLHPEKIEEILDTFGQHEVPPARIAGNIAQINQLFASDRLEDILAALEADGGAWAAKELATLRSKSPLSNKVALRQLAEGARFTYFADNMRNEYRIASRMLTRPDFAEGVRAVIVDKDNSPHWNPATPEAVSDDLIDAIFAPLPADQEWKPL